MSSSLILSAFGIAKQLRVNEGAADVRGVVTEFRFVRKPWKLEPGSYGFFLIFAITGDPLERQRLEIECLAPSGKMMFQVEVHPNSPALYLPLPPVTFEETGLHSIRARLAGASVGSSALNIIASNAPAIATYA